MRSARRGEGRRRRGLVVPFPSILLLTWGAAPPPFALLSCFSRHRGVQGFAVAGGDPIIAPADTRVRSSLPGALAAPRPLAAKPSGPSARRAALSWRPLTVCRLEKGDSEDGEGDRGDDESNLRSESGEEEEEGAVALQWKQKAESLRQQIRQMERQLDEELTMRMSSTGSKASNSSTSISTSNDVKAYDWMRRDTEDTTASDGPGGSFSLRNKRVLVAGANGRLGSMVCRYLLRNFPSTQVVAAVHVVGENSPTARGYGRLGYEVGAEDGVGTLGAAWSEQRTATFQYDPTAMEGYNLQNLRVVECELLDPVQCQSVVEGCDAVIWCATDFNQNVPRAVSSLNVALLFRAVSRPTKGRVDVEGVQNMLGAIKQNLQERRRTRNNASPASSVVNFVLVSKSPDAYDDYETPFGSLRGIKQQGEELTQQFPSLTTTVIRMARFEDNFVGEDLAIQMEEVPRRPGAGELSLADTSAKKSRRKINRRDAARAAVEALVNEDLVGKTMEVWTAT